MRGRSPHPSFLAQRQIWGWSLLLFLQRLILPPSPEFCYHRPTPPYPAVLSFLSKHLQTSAGKCCWGKRPTDPKHCRGWQTERCPSFLSAPIQAPPRVLPQQQAWDVSPLPSPPASPPEPWCNSHGCTSLSNPVENRKCNKERGSHAWPESAVATLSMGHSRAVFSLQGPQNLSRYELKRGRQVITSACWVWE